MLKTRLMFKNSLKNENFCMGCNYKVKYKSQNKSQTFAIDICFVLICRKLPKK